MANNKLCIAVILALCMSYVNASSGPYFKIKVHRLDDSAPFEFSATKMADYIYNSGIEATEACRNMESSENTVCQNILICFNVCEELLLEICRFYWTA